VRGLVTADYQELLEKAWVDELRKKYTVVVNKDVLATVNKHD
jgi:peptidyl-prolyl cis-trans isomerase SurA